MPIAQLEDRGAISITGEDAVPFLDNIVTNDLTALAIGQAAYAALLTPQGKIITDCFVVRSAGTSLLVDVPLRQAPEFAKRLTMYKLRAKVAIADTSATTSVFAVWSGGAPRPETGVDAQGTIVFRDPRHPDLGYRMMAARGQNPTGQSLASSADYAAWRIRLGIPEGGKDWAFGDAFPHEALLDQLHGVSFTKGCYVGQEIVARMQHRGTARKRVVRVVASVALPVGGTEVRAGDVPIGTLGSVRDCEGLAMVRLDRAAEASAKGQTITVGGVAVAIEIPPWATFAMSTQP